MMMVMRFDRRPKEFSLPRKDLLHVGKVVGGSFDGSKVAGSPFVYFPPDKCRASTLP